MKVNINLLRSSIDTLLKQVQEMRGDEIEIDADLYWFVQKESLHDPSSEPVAEPGGLTLGSLDDDWQQIQGVASGEKEGFGYMLVWASSLLRALGDRTL